MVQAVITLSEFENRVVNVVKAKFGLKNKSEAISKIIEDNFDEYFELRPEYVEKLKRIDEESPRKSFTNTEELRKYLANL